MKPNFWRTLAVLVPVLALALGSSGCSYFRTDDGPSESDVEVITIAGTGEIGNADGDGMSATFNNPDGVTVMNNGDAYITDLGNNEIKEVAADGTVTTIAGAPEPGYADGPGDVARFDTPDGITHDAAGNLYIADSGNNAIRKVEPDGTTTTLAGGGPDQPGDVDGAGADARFDFPTGITIDAAGNLYVSDQDNDKVRKVTPEGVVTTVAGTGEPGFADGDAAAAQFDSPHGIAIDAAGNLFVTDQGNSRVREISLAGEVTTIAGNGTAGDVVGPAGESEINTPHGITVADDGTVYFADELNNKIKAVDPAGEVETVAGSGAASFADGDAAVAAFHAPRGLTITQSDDFLVCDYTNQRVRKIIVDENEMVTIAGSGADGDRSGSAAAAAFDAPAAVAITPGDETIIADAGNNKIKIVETSGETTTLAGSVVAGFVDGKGTAARFNDPQGVVSDSAGNVYVADAGNNAVRMVTPSGVVVTIAGNGASGASDGAGAAASFNRPVGIAIDAADNLYVADEGNALVRKVTPAGEVTTIAGTGVPGFSDGAAAAAQFAAPSAVAVDAGGNVYVADTDNSRVRMITPGGEVTTIAGDGTAAFADGPGATSEVNAPKGIAVDGAGDIYVADTGNNRIRVIDGDTGKVTTVAGTGAEGDADSSKAKKAKMNEPQGLAIGYWNNAVVIADTANNKVKAIEKRN